MGSGNNRSEIDVDRDILQTRQVKRVRVRVMTVVTHQRAASALLVIKLPAGESRNQSVAARHAASGVPIRQTQARAARLISLSKPGWKHALTPDLFGSRQERASRRAFAPRETSVGVELDTALKDIIFTPDNNIGRHRIQQFIRHDDTGELLRQSVQPCHSRQKMRSSLGNAFLLTLTQIG